MQEQTPPTHANNDAGFETTDHKMKDRALEDSPQFEDSPSNDNYTTADLGPAPNLDQGGNLDQGDNLEQGRGPSGAEADGVADAETSTTELAAQLAHDKDRMLRLQADMENLRGRTSREIAEERRYGSLPLVRDLLPVVDNIDRAIQATEDQNGSDLDGPKPGESDVDAGLSTVVQTDGDRADGDQGCDQDGLLEGFKLVRQQLLTLLEQYHCHPIEAEGQPFDPKFHQAILQQPSDDHPAGNVMMVTQTGYIMHDRVVRAPQVIVSTGPA